METRYHIGLLTGTLLILAILSYAYYADYNYRKEIARTEQTEQQETEQTVSTQGGAHKEGVYYLKNRNGYVIVYLDDQTSIYEYTNIRVEELPEELQNEIREGKRLLAETDLAPSQIASILGFSSSSYFCKTFSNIEGTSPTEYRKANQVKF